MTEYDKSLVIYYKDGSIRRTQLSSDFDPVNLPGLVHDLTHGRARLDRYEYEDLGKKKKLRQRRAA